MSFLPYVCMHAHSFGRRVPVCTIAHTRSHAEGRRSPKDHSRCSPITWRSTPGITPYRQPRKVKCCVLLSHKYNFQQTGMRPACLMSTHLPRILRIASVSVFPTLIRCLIQSPCRSNRRMPALTHLSVTFHEAGHRGVEQSAGRPRVPFFLLPLRQPHAVPTVSLLLCFG